MRNCLLKSFMVFLSVWLLHTVRSEVRAAGLADDGNIIYGYLAPDNDSSGAIVALDLESGEILEKITEVNYAPLGGVYGEGLYYTSTTYFSGMGTVNTTTGYSTKDWSVVSTGSFELNLPVYDRTSDNIYMIRRQNGDLLFYDEMALGASTTVGNISHSLLAMAVNNEGQLYTVSNQGILYKVNKFDASVEEVGSLGLDIKWNMDYKMGAIFGEDNNYFYLAAELTSGETGLYKVNVATGEAALLYDFPNNEKYVSLFFDNGQISDDAPGQASLIIYRGNELGGLTGRVTFKVAETTNGGESLTGKVSARVHMNSTLVATLDNLDPGQNVTIENVTAPGHGSTKVWVVLSNENGNGPAFGTKFWVGYDQPQAVTNISVVIDENTGKPLISWNAPSIDGVNGGYVDIDKVTYEIRRYSDEYSFEIIEPIWEGTRFLDESLEVGELTVYAYGISSTLEGLTGNIAMSSKFKVGEPHSIPFYWGVITGSNSYLFDLFTFVDVNGNNSVWGTSAYGISSPSTSTLNTWAYTAPIKIDKPGTYDLSYLLTFQDTYVQGKTNNLAIAISKDVNPSGNDIEVVDMEGITNSISGSTLSHWATIEEAGTYYIGFHNYGSYIYSDNTEIRINNISLNLLAGEGMPNTATGLKLNAPQKGELAPVEIEFVLPEIDAANKPLASVTGYKIYRNGSEDPISVVENAENPVTLQPGATVVVWDNNAIAGFNTYKVVISNENGDGLYVEETLFVGADIPEAVNELQVIKAGENEAKITWTNSKGVNGGYVDVAALRFKIQRHEGLNTKTLTEDYAISPEDMEELTDDEGNIYVAYKGEYLDTTIPEEGQFVYTYEITPYYNNTQVGASAISKAIRFGAAYSLPFMESFADKSYDKTGWLVEVIEGTASTTAWEITDVIPYNYPNTEAQDEDGGLAAFNGNNAPRSTVRLMTPEISTENMEAPSLIFWYYHPYSTGRGINISIALDGSEEFEVIREIPAVSYGEREELYSEWTRHEIDLTPYKDSQTIMIGFDGYDTSGSSWSSNVAIDNISIINREGVDFEITYIAGPTKVLAGGFNNMFEIDVRNKGAEATDHFTIEWYNGDELVGTIDGEEIKALELRTFTYVIKASLEEVGEVNEYYAVVKIEEDLTPDNNVSETLSVEVLASVYPVVTALNGSADDEKISLTWNESISIPTPVVVEGRLETSSYLAWEDPDPNNSWNNIYWNLFTSPELPGIAQTIRLYVEYTGSVEGQNKFQLFVSETDNDFDTFVEFGDSIEVSNNELLEVMYDLPEGTKYFQVRRVEYAYTTFNISQTFFVKAAEDESVTVVTGYNVYRDGIKIGTSTATAYQDEDPNEGDNTYQVTAVYGEDQESEYSEEKVINFVITGIDGIQILLSVYTTEGSIIIEGADQLPISVTNVQGALVVLKEGTGNDVISVPAGIYLVKVADKVVKVNVK